jgi:hypothetical protein
VSDFWIAVIVALIPVVGGGVGWLIKFMLEFRDENRADHNVVMEAITELKQDVRDVKGDLHDHMAWHVTKKK